MSVVNSNCLGFIGKANILYFDIHTEYLNYFITEGLIIKCVLCQCHLSIQTVVVSVYKLTTIKCILTSIGVLYVGQLPRHWSNRMLARPLLWIMISSNMILGCFLVLRLLLYTGCVYFLYRKKSVA